MNSNLDTSPGRADAMRAYDPFTALLTFRPPRRTIASAPRSITATQAYEIDQLLDRGMRQCDIARKLGIGPHVIAHIVRKRNGKR